MDRDIAIRRFPPPSPPSLLMAGSAAEWTNGDFRRFSSLILPLLIPSHPTVGYNDLWSIRISRNPPFFLFSLLGSFFSLFFVGGSNSVDQTVVPFSAREKRDSRSLNSSVSPFPPPSFSRFFLFTFRPGTSGEA